MGSPRRPRSVDAVSNGVIGVCPAALPQRQVGGVAGIRRQAGLMVHGRTRSFEVGPRIVEVAAAELDVRAQHERHVRVVGGDRAQRLQTGALGGVPLPDRHEGFDPVRRKHGVLDPVTAEGVEPCLS